MLFSFVFLGLFVRSREPAASYEEFHSSFLVVVDRRTLHFASEFAVGDSGFRNDDSRFMKIARSQSLCSVGSPREAELKPPYHFAHFGGHQVQLVEARGPVTPAKALPRPTIVVVVLARADSPRDRERCGGLVPSMTSWQSR